MPLPRTGKWLSPWSMSNTTEWPVYWGRTFCSHISTMLSDPDGLLVGHVLAILTARATGRSSLCVLGCPGAAKTFALWCSLLCLDAALGHRVLWTSQQHSALLAVVGIATNLLKDAPRWLQRLLVVRRVSGDGPVISTTHDHVAFVAAAVSAGIGEPQGRTTAKNIHHDHPAVAEPPSRQECTHARSDASFLHAAIASGPGPMMSAILSPALTR